MNRDCQPNSGDREHPGQLRRQTADLERTAVAGGTPLAGFVDDERHPARQPLGRLKVEHNAMIARGDQVEKVASQFANLRFLDQGFFQQPNDCHSALVGNLKTLPRVECRGTRGQPSAVLRLPLEAGQILNDLGPGARDLGHGELGKVEMTGDPVFHSPVVVKGGCRGLGEQTHSLGKQRRPRRRSLPAASQPGDAGDSGPSTRAIVNSSCFMKRSPAPSTHRNTWADVTDQNQTWFVAASPSSSVGDKPEEDGPVCGKSAGKPKQEKNLSAVEKKAGRCRTDWR